MRIGPPAPDASLMKLSTKMTLNIGPSNSGPLAGNFETEQTCYGIFLVWSRLTLSPSEWPDLHQIHLTAAFPGGRFFQLLHCHGHALTSSDDPAEVVRRGARAPSIPGVSPKARRKNIEAVCRIPRFEFIDVTLLGAAHPLL